MTSSSGLGRCEDLKGSMSEGAGGRPGKQEGIVKLSECDQNLGHTRNHHSLIVQHSGYGPEGENQPNLTYVDNTNCEKQYGFSYRPRFQNPSKIDNSRLSDTELQPLRAFKNLFCDRTHVTARRYTGFPLVSRLA